MKTTLIQEDKIARQWYLIDAAGKPAGRLASKICHILRGKTKPSFSPHIDGGDFVLVVNAAKVKLTGNKESQKIYKNFTGYPGGLKLQTAAVIRKKNPTRIIEQAVKGMLPKNHLSRTQIKRLKVYPGEEHPHIAQQPKALAI